MAEGMKIGAGHVDISADMTNLDNALGAMPAKVGRQFAATIQSMQAALARNKLEFKMLGPDDGSAAWRQLADELAAAQNKLKASLDLVRQAVVSKATAMAAAAQATASARQAAKDLADANAKLAASAKQAAADQVRAANAAANAAKQAAKVKAAADREMQDSTGASTNKLAVFAQTLDDLQYVPEMGLRPILNNLVQISPALGILGIAVQAVISNWDTLIGVMGSGKLETEAAEMERLGQATQMTADEADRLRQLQGDVTASAKVRDAKSPEKVEQTRAVDDVITKHAGEKLVEAILATDPNLVPNAREKARLEAPGSNPYETLKGFGAAIGESAGGGNVLEMMKRQHAEGEAAREGRAQEIARKDAGQSFAQMDPNQVKELIAKLEKLPDAGKRFPGLIGDLHNSLPENRKAQEQLEREGEIQAKQVRERMAEVKKEQQEQERRVEKQKDQEREDARNKIEDQIKANQKVKEGLREDLEKRKRVPETIFSGIDDYFKRIQKTVDKPAFNGIEQQIKRTEEGNKILRDLLEETKRQQSREARLG
jgi:hypothetical protein